MKRSLLITVTIMMLLTNTHIIANTKNNSGKKFTPKKAMLATPIREKDYVIGWLMSEKYDGVRGIWYKNKLYSKRGNQFHPPKWFSEVLPDNITLDGELFVARMKFNSAVSIVRRKKPTADWKKIKYMIFDIPTYSNKPFIKRIKIYTSLVNKICSKKWPGIQKKYPQVENLNCPVIPIKQIPITSRKDKNTHYKIIVDNKGEGIIIRDPNSLYYYSYRCECYLKQKPYFINYAKVVGYNYYKNKKFKSLKVQLIPNRHYNKICGETKCKIFNLGVHTMKNNYKKYFHINKTIVKIRYQNLTDNCVPRFPILTGFKKNKFKN